MTIVTTKVLMKKAEQNGIAIPAYNIDNLESALAVTNVVKRTGKSVIIQMIPRTLNYGGVATYPAMIFSLLKGIETEVAIHLDHASNFQLIKDAIDCGFSSVMIDGSHLPLKKTLH
jgi:fructose/tagatose bisphosphate aldolase